MLPKNKMPEAEVTLRLAIAIIQKGYAASSVQAAIDGAQIKTGSNVVFPIVDFLNGQDWYGDDNSKWQCVYKNKKHPGSSIIVHSTPGEGDLVVSLVNGFTLRVESKKGPIEKSKSSPEYPLIREAIGQLMTIKTINDDDVLAVAVPKSVKFEALAQLWRERPLMKKTGIYIITVDRENPSQSLDECGIKFD